MAIDFQPHTTLSFAEITVAPSEKLYKVKFFSGITLDENEAIQLIEASFPLADQMGYIYTLSDMSEKYIDVTNEARSILSDNKSLRLLKANAIIVRDLPIRMMSNFFLKFNKPVIPFKTFTEEEAAIKWLLSH